MYVFISKIDGYVAVGIEEVWRPAADHPDISSGYRTRTFFTTGANVKVVVFLIMQTRCPLNSLTHTALHGWGATLSAAGNNKIYYRPAASRGEEISNYAPVTVFTQVDVYK